MRREAIEIPSVGEWLAMRERDVTASRVAALFNAHPYMSRAQFIETMRGRSQGSNAAMRRGRILEPAVAAAVAEERPEWSLRKATTYHRLPEHRIGATPDYFADTEAGLVNVQCKTVSPEVWEKWRGQPPLGYKLQVVCENLATDAAAGVLAVMVTAPSYPLHLFDVPRHAGAEERILLAVGEWWAAWDAGEIADATPAEEIAAALDDGSHKDLSGDNAIRELLTTRANLKQCEAAIKTKLGEVEYEIKNRIGPASTAWLPGWSLSFRSQHRKSYTVAASDSRVLRIKEVAEEV